MNGMNTTGEEYRYEKLKWPEVNEAAVDGLDSILGELKGYPIREGTDYHSMPQSASDYDQFRPR